MAVIEKAGGGSQQIVADVRTWPLVGLRIISEHAKSARDVETLASFFKERPHGVPEKVGQIHAAGKRQPLTIAVSAFKVGQAGHDVRFQIDGTVARWSDKSGRGRAHAFDRL